MLYMENVYIFGGKFASPEHTVRRLLIGYVSAAFNIRCFPCPMSVSQKAVSLAGGHDAVELIKLQNIIFKHKIKDFANFIPKCVL